MKKHWLVLPIVFILLAGFVILLHGKEVESEKKEIAIYFASGVDETVRNELKRQLSAKSWNMEDNKDEPLTSYKGSSGTTKRAAQSSKPFRDHSGPEWLKKFGSPDSFMLIVDKDGSSPAPDEKDKISITIIAPNGYAGILSTSSQSDWMEDTVQTLDSFWNSMHQPKRR